MLLHIHPAFAVCVIPGLVALGLIAIPYLTYESDTGGVWFASGNGRRLAAGCALVSLVGTPAVIVADEFLTGANQSAVSNGLVPVVLLIGILAVFYGILRRRFSATVNEGVQAVFVMLVVAYIVLTVTGVWFRGEGMVMRWPW